MSDDEQKPAAEETKEAPDTESKRLPPAELFAKYDEDASGAIDTDELFKLLSACKYNPDDEMAMKLMAEFGDGMEEELNFEQFSGMLRALDKRILFKQYDEDGSGAIDADELAAMLAACGHDSSPDFVSGLIERHSKGGGELDVEGFGAVLAELDEKGGEQLAAAQEAQRAEVAEAAEAAEAAPADPPPQEATPADDDDAAASPQQATPAADSDEDAAEAPAAVAEGVASSDGGASSDGAQATEADTKPAICKTQEFYFYDVKPAAAPSPAPAAEGSDRGTNATHYFFCAGGDDSSLSERDMGVFFCSYRPPHDD